MSFSDDDDMPTEDDTQPCMENMVRMLEGSVESQYAAATAMVQCCVTKSACDQLVACGFPSVAQAILQKVALHKSDVFPAQLPLLRCILLVISTVMACSEELRVTVTQNTSMR